MILHAYRRTKPIEVGFPDLLLKFEPNEAGDIVCDVPEGPALTRLLEITEGYRPYGAAPAEDEDSDEPPSPYILTAEGEDGQEVTLDLRTLDRAALDKFAAENGMPPFHHKLGDDKRRDAIVAFLRGG